MGRLTALVLGSAAGGGFPQWNCRCPTCRLAGMGGRCARAAAHPSESRRQRGRRKLAPDQRVPGPSPAGSAMEGAASAQRNTRNRMLMRRRGLWLGSANASSNRAILPPVARLIKISEIHHSLQSHGTRLRRVAPRPELRITNAAAQTRTVSEVRIPARFLQICAIFQRDNLRRHF
jgi:hypothetical protein